MSATLSFSPKTPSALLDALSKAQWPAVVEAIEAGYPINVKDAEGNPFFHPSLKRLPLKQIRYPFHGMLQ